MAGMTQESKYCSPRRADPVPKMPVKIGDLDWYEDAGALLANVHFTAADRAILEVSPLPNGRWQGRVIGFLGIVFWKQRDFDSQAEA